MTRTRFKRLFVVLLGPLLIAGAILAFMANKDAGSLNMRCQIGLFGSENCRPTGWADFDERVAKEAPAWFDVKTRPYEKNSFPTVSVSASQRQIKDVQIIDVFPYAGTADGPGSPLSELRSLSDHKISIIFGVRNESARVYDPLGCNELDFEEAASGIFRAGLCGIPNGVAQVQFRVGEQGQKELMALKAAVDNETAEGRRIMILGYLILTPIFVVLFLLLSGLVWIVRRATSYVAAG